MEAAGWSCPHDHLSVHVSTRPSFWVSSVSPLTLVTVPPPRRDDSALEG